MKHFKRNLIWIILLILPLIIILPNYSGIANCLFPSNSDRNGELIKLLLSIEGGIGILFGLFVSYTRAITTEESVKRQGEAIGKQSEQIELSRKSQIDERFKNGIEHLGSDKEPIILGGIAELNQIAKENQKEYAEVVFIILCSYIRSNTNIYEKLATDFNHTAIQMIIDCLFKLPINSNNPYINCNANLSHSNLIGTNLDNCNFSNADLSFCLMPSLENVNLKNANISKAKFTLATLHNLDFFNTKIYGTIFQYVQIKDITFENCQTPIVLHFIDSELKNINFENSKINSSSFLSSHLSNVSFKNSEVSDTKFSCSILSKISFLNCDYMYELDFRASGLTEVIFNSYILKAKFNGCDNSYKEYRPLIEDRLKDRIGKIAEVSSINYNTTSFDKCQIGILSQLDVDEIMGFYDELGKSISPRSAKATHK